jgi:hypothetical protein
MNTSTPFRNSYLRASTYHFNLGFDPTINPGPVNEKAVSQKGVFVQAEYSKYRAKCDALGIFIARLKAEPTTALVVSPFGKSENSNFLNSLLRVATVYPHKDMNWLVAVMFTFGSVVFTVNAIFGFLPVAAPSTTFASEATIAFPATLTLGAFTFRVGGSMALFGSFNIDRVGNAEKIEMEIEPEEKGIESANTYQPALLGSKE